MWNPFKRPTEQDANVIAASGERPVLYREQPSPRNDFFTSYNYPPAQSEHGRWYNNVYWGNRIPNSYMVGIPNVTNNLRFWPVQTSPAQTYFNQLNHGTYGKATLGVYGSASLLQQMSQAYYRAMTTGGQ